MQALNRKIGSFLLKHANPCTRTLKPYTHQIRTYATQKRKMSFKDFIRFVRTEKTSMLLMNFLTIFTIANASYLTYLRYTGQQAAPDWLKEIVEDQKKKLEQLQQQKDSGEKILTPEEVQARKAVASGVHIDNPYRGSPPSTPSS